MVIKTSIKIAFLFLAVAALCLYGVISNNAQYKAAKAFISLSSQIPEEEQVMLAAEALTTASTEAPGTVTDEIQTAPTNAPAYKSKISSTPGLKKTDNSVTFGKGNVIIKYDLLTGTADFYSHRKRVITGFYSAVKLPGMITSKNYTSRVVTQKGNEYTVVLSGGDYPTMRQRFNLDHLDYFTLSVEVEGKELSSNWMAPIVTDIKSSVDIGSYKDVMALWVPFDNDRDVKYDASTINKEDTGYEVSAFYDNYSRNGLVIGSVTHDTWKTGIDYKGTNNKLDLLKVYGGASINSSQHDAMKRDSQEHGYVKGNILLSPKIFVGFFNDWRIGMEKYADANAEVTPKLKWDNGVVFGWNSWGAVGDKLNTDNALAAAAFIKDSLMSQNYQNDNTAYINLDSYWDSPSIDLEKFVETVHKNGQKAGIYWSPFVDWARSPNRSVEGSKYKYKDIWLKDSKGNPITYGNGPYALDPTHPGTLQRIDYYIDYFKFKGFDEYIKLDFLSHAALEGQHYDRAVATGMQAINKGMRYLLDTLQNKMGSDIFISQAISPLFPYQYAHSRRISCDKFGFLYESRDVMNASAYGWWMNGRIYSFNDPDHLVLYSAWWNKNEKISENEAKTRVTSAIIGGTVFLSGDDFSAPDARIRAAKYLTNQNINSIAKLGKAFRPLEGNTGSSAPDMFTLDGDNGVYYLAVFNWDGSKSVEKTIDLARAGLDPNKKYTAVEQWSNTASVVSKNMKVSLAPAEAKIFLVK